MSNDPKTYLFDMDGLLLNTERMSYEAWLTVAAKFGIDLAQVYPLVIGKGRKVCDEIFQEHFGAAVPFAEMRQKKNQLLKSQMEECIPPKIGALALLQHLESTSQITGLVTSSTKPEAEFRLAKAGLFHDFDVQIFGEDVRKGKPEPEGYLLAASRLNVEPANCIVFEDSHAGVQAALSAGMHVIMVPDLIPPEEWVYASGVVIKESLDAVLAELLELSSRS